MTKKSDAPAIRFKGFSDAWEQRKFDEVFDCTVPNNTLSRAELSYDEGTVLNVHYGDVLIKYGSVLDVQKDDIPRIPHRCREDFNGALLQDGDVIIADTAEDETTGKACEIGNLQGSAIVSGLHTMVCRPRNRMALGYLGYYLNSNAYHHQLLPLMQGIKVLSLSRSNIQKTSVSYPIAVKEQQLIAYYFSQLDNLITLHQRKFEKLTNVKKSMLEKMFPQNGSSYPEIRFKGFTDPWEQRKLSEITDKVTEKNAGLQYVETFTNSAEFGIISQRDFFDHDIAKLGSLDGYYIVKTEDFVYNPRISTSAPVGPINRNKLGRTGVMSPLYTVFRPHDIDTTYLEYFFKCGYWHSFMNFNGDSGARSDRFSIRDNVFFQMPIPIPDIDEQRKIGELLTCLDNLITLHQRKCANLCSPSQVVFSLLFATSTFSWEQRKFDEVFDCTVPNNTLSRAELSYDEGTVLNVHYGDVLIKYGSVLDVQKDDIPRIPHRCREDFNGALLQDGDVIIADTAEDETTGKACEIGNLQGSAIVSGLHTMVCRPRNRMALGYLGYYLNSNAYHHQLLPLMQGIKVLSLSRSNIQKTSVSYPIAVKEQQLIAYYFSQLDNLITLHQRKFEKLTNVKKSMLEKMFPQNGSSYPEIRFKGFTDPWEQRKLSEITDKVTEKNAGLQYVETFTNSAEFGIISQRDFFDHDIAKLGSLDGYYIVKTEDFVYNPRISTSAPVGPINRNKLGRTGVMSPLYTVFRPHDIDTTYLEYFFKCGYWHSFMNFNGDSGARSDRFSIRDNVFFQMPIPIPDIDEQRKIGELLTCLDNLITLHQRELEKLQNIKKSMLEKMFV